MSRCYPFPPPGYIRNTHAELEISSKKEKRKHKDKKKKRKHKDTALNGDLILQEDGSLERVQQSGLVDEGCKTTNERLSEAKSVLLVASTQGNFIELKNDIVRESALLNCALANNAARPEKRRQSCMVKSKSNVLSAKSELLLTDIRRENMLHNGCVARDITRSPQRLHFVSTTEMLPSIMLATQSKRLKADMPEHRRQSGELNNDGHVLSLSTKCELLHADIHRESMLFNGCVAMDITRSPQSMQVESTTKALTSSTLAIPSKRLKTDGSREKVTSNGSAAVTYKRAEQGLLAGCVADQVFSNGVLKTKRKRLQADNHEGELLPSAAPSSICKRTQQGLHCRAGDTNTEVASNSVQATDRMNLQADRPRNKYLNHAIVPERFEERFQVDDLHITAVTNCARVASVQGGIAKAKELSSAKDGAWAASVQVGTVKAKELSQHLHKAVRDGSQTASVQVGTVKAKELSQHLHKGVRDGAQPARIQLGTVKDKELSQRLNTTNGKLQADEQKHEVKLTSTLSAECQADNVRAKSSSNGVHAGKSVQTVQSRNVVSDCMRDSAVRSLTSVREKAFSEVLCATIGKILQGDSLAKGAFDTGVTESTKREQWRSFTPEAASHVEGAVTCNGEEAGHSRHDAICCGAIVDGRLHADESCTMILSHSILGNNEKAHCRFQEDQAAKKTMSNGTVAMNCEDFTTELLSHAVARPVDAEAAKNATILDPASKGKMERDDELVGLCRHLAWPHSLQVCAIADDDDEWLISSSNQCQAKPEEKWDSQIPQAQAQWQLLKIYRKGFRMIFDCPRDAPG